MTQVLARTIPIELRTRAQLALGTAHVRQGNPNKAMPVLEEAIAAAERSNWPRALPVTPRP
jgi:hypothetical protein